MVRQGVISLVIAVVLVVATVGPAPTSAAQVLPVSFHRYTTSADFSAAGSSFDGAILAPGGGALTYGSTAGSYSYTDPYGYGTRTYTYARWTSPLFSSGFGFTE